jgi:hypothetical protein
MEKIKLEAQFEGNQWLFPSSRSLHFVRYEPSHVFSHGRSFMLSLFGMFVPLRGFVG